jgi:membrane fusion protein (multidrug efflux system)
MAAASVSLIRSRQFRVGAGILVLVITAGAAWFYLTAGRESTDDAQLDARVSQVASRVGGTIARIAIDDNQLVEAGTVLVELDPRDYQVALDKARV